MTSKISDEELVNLFNKNKLFNLFNMTVLEVNTDAGSIKMEFEVEQKYCNPAGDVQGGIVSGMVDDATALAFIFQNHFKKRPLRSVRIKSGPDRLEPCLAVSARRYAASNAQDCLRSAASVFRADLIASSHA